MKHKETKQFVGLDLGKLRDHTAVAVVERVQALVRKTWTTTMSLLALRRVKLGTSYSQIAKDVKKLLAGLAGLEPPQLVVDATGVGVAVLEILRGELGENAPIVPVMFTGGAMTRMEEEVYFVPKRDLVAGMLDMLERGQLKIPAKLSERVFLLREFEEMESRVSRYTLQERHAAWRECDHDDLVFALALACWRARRTMMKLPPIDEEALKRN